jgi:parallel beta-helix repeat protein
MGIYAESTATISDIRYNKIDYPCQLVNDAGGIYMGHDHPGTVVDHNIVLYSGGNGIYLDEYCTGVTCTSNTIAHSAGNGIMLHKAHQNTVTDNNVFNNAVGIKFTNWDNVKNLYENILSRNTFVAKSGQIVANLTNRYTGDNEWGTGSGNYYCRPIDDGQSFDTNLPVVGGALKTFAQWKTIVNTDSTSAQSPAGITSDAQIQFEYNYSSADVLKAVPVASIDMAGIKYASSILLSAWSSAILIPDPSPAGGQNGSGLKKAFIASNGNYYLNPLTGKAYVH